MAKPWADAGYTCYCVDTQHPYGSTIEGNIIKIRADVLTWEPPTDPVAFAAFFPPCTDVAVSGARYFKDKGLGALIRALQLFQGSVELATDFGCPYLIENPVSTISTYWRKPDHYFDPCDYGYPWTKKTCLWTGGGFVMPPKTPIEPVLGSKMHKLSPSPTRANERAVTLPGFARAVFNSNHVKRI